MYIKRLDYLMNNMSDPISKFFGDVKGSKIIENQISSFRRSNKPETGKVWK